MKDKTLHIEPKLHKALKSESILEDKPLNKLVELKLGIPLALLKKAKLIK